MTKEQLINHYCEQIFYAQDKNAKTQKILREIESLTYDRSNNPISRADKLDILKGLHRLIILKLYGYDTVNESRQPLLLHSLDNKEYLELIKLAIQRLGGTK